MSDSYGEFDQDGPNPADLLSASIYSELRVLAVNHLRHEPTGQTLQATALVHEAYLRLNASYYAKDVSKRQFFAAAALAMRRILIDNARRKKSLKRGDDWQRIAMEEAFARSSSANVSDIQALTEVLEEFAVLHPRQAELVNLRYFTGRTEVEAAEILGISRETASRDWRYARAWLLNRLDAFE